MRTNNMQARVLEWKTKAKDRNSALQRLEDIKQESVAQELEKRHVALVDDALKKIPLRYQGKSWVDFKVENADQKKIKNIIQCYSQTFSSRLNEGTNIIFSGKPGTGKTLLSLILYQHLVQINFSAIYESSLDFLRVLQEKKFGASGVYTTAIENYKRAPFLIIDESTEGCGKNGFLTDWERGLLFKLIDTRYQQKRCTLIISNRTRDEIRARLSEPTFDRLLEKGISLAFNWNSYRK